MSCRYCRGSKLDPSCERDLEEDPCPEPHPCPCCQRDDLIVDDETVERLNEVMKLRPEFVSIWTRDAR